MVAPQGRAQPTPSAPEKNVAVKGCRAGRGNCGFFRDNPSPTKYQAIFDHYVDQIRDVLIALRARGLSQRHIVAELNMLGMAPPCGVKWDLETVRRVLGREKPESV